GRRPRRRVHRAGADVVTDVDGRRRRREPPAGPRRPPVADRAPVPRRRAAFRRPFERYVLRVVQTGRTLAACRPFGPCWMSNSTVAPSSRLRYPELWIAE